MAKGIFAKAVPVVLGVLAYYAILSPDPISDVQPYETGPLPEFKGILEPNNRLGESELMHQDLLKGPEAFDFDEDGFLYVSVGDGRVMRSAENRNYNTTKFITLAYISNTISEEFRTQYCGLPEYEHICGRPLGIRYNRREKHLIVIDSYFGLMKIDKSGTITGISSSYEGIRYKFLNALAVADDGTIYFTDSSTKYHRREFFLETIESNPNGRLFAYNPSTGVSLLSAGLHFPNGIDLEPGQESVLFAELTRFRVQRYYVKGPKKGQIETFADNLPCLPDNLRYDPDNKLYWIGCASKRAAPFSLVDAVAPYPKARVLLSKFISYPLVKKVVKYSLVIALDENGKVARSLHDPDAKIGAVSEVLHHDGYLYMGSFDQPFLARLRL